MASRIEMNLGMKRIYFRGLKETETEQTDEKSKKKKVM